MINFFFRFYCVEQPSSQTELQQIEGAEWLDIEAGKGLQQNEIREKKTERENSVGLPSMVIQNDDDDDDKNDNNNHK